MPILNDIMEHGIIGPAMWLEEHLAKLATSEL
jgi:hypothetical protein